MIPVELTLTDPAMLTTGRAPSIICITGTGTGIGKTVATGLIARFLTSHQSVVTQKWVQSGELHAPDIHTHDAFVPHPFLTDHPQRQVYSFESAVSPHLAARIAGQSIDPLRLIQATHDLSQHADTVLVETSGGIMVPLTDTVSFLDVMAMMAIPTIVVIPNQLGAINHALMTLSCLTHREIPVLGFIMNHMVPPTHALHHDNPITITRMSGVAHMGTIHAMGNS